MMNDIQLSFETHEDLAECMFELVEETKDIVYAVVFYDDAKQLLKELGYIQETVFSNINLEDPEWTEYNKEYYVTIDKDYEISVEPAWHEKSEWRDACYLTRSAMVVAKSVCFSMKTMKIQNVILRIFSNTLWIIFLKSSKGLSFLTDFINNGEYYSPILP